MADPNSLRIARSRSNVSRSSSARSSAIYDESRQPSLPHGLHTVASRFSLNEQFAASRREYDFGDDDGASLLDRATLALDVSDGLGQQDVEVEEDEDEGEELSLDGDFYDMLCLPWVADTTQDQIRQAYHRMFLLFYPDNYPDNLRATATQQFTRIQEAFETLIDPERRAIYDADLAAEGDRWDETVPDRIRTQNRPYNDVPRAVNTASELGVRFDATRHGNWSRNGPSGKQTYSLRPLDFVLSHALRIDLPVRRKGTKKARRSKDSSLMDVDGDPRPGFEMPSPTLLVSGSVYGVVEDMSRMPITLLSEAYQPLAHATKPIIDLAKHKMSPLISVTARQEFINKPQAIDLGRVRWVQGSVEVTTDLIPAPTLSTNISHDIVLPRLRDITSLDVGIRSSVSTGRRIPNLTLGLRHRLGPGTAFIHGDSGDWTPRAGGTCHFFTEFSKMTRKLSFAEFPLTTEPKLEIGLASGSMKRPFASYQTGLLHDQQGPSQLFKEFTSQDEDTWTVMASASLTHVTGFLRYSKDLTRGVLSSLRGSPTQVEAELCTSMFRDRYLALRSLWSVGCFSRLGLEVGISTHNVHLSVYWSRRGQRLGIPLLISQHALLSSKILLWAGTLSLASIAIQTTLLHTIRHRRRTNPPSTSSITHSRQQADVLTALLTPTVTTLQKHRAAQHGVSIISAKFGVQDASGSWGDEEVADVTVAVAALVPSAAGGLVIPRGVRKSRLPGFWDPAPGREKVLHVRYVWSGREAVVEVRGRGELVVPPRYIRDAW